MDSALAALCNVRRDLMFASDDNEMVLAWSGRHKSRFSARISDRTRAIRSRKRGERSALALFERRSYSRLDIIYLLRPNIHNHAKCLNESVTTAQTVLPKSHPSQSPTQSKSVYSSNFTRPRSSWAMPSKSQKDSSAKSWDEDKRLRPQRRTRRMRKE